MAKNKSTLLSLLDGYETHTDKGGELGGKHTEKSFFSRSLSGSFTGRRNASNRLITLIKTGIRMLVYTSTRVYGIMLIAFGSLAALAELMSAYFGSDAHNRMSLITSLVLVLFGVIFTFADKPVGMAFEDFLPTDFVLFEFFCLKRMRKGVQQIQGYPAFVGVIVGVLFAALGVFISPIRVVFAALILFFVLLSLASPEFSFLVSLLALPYISFFESSTLIFSVLLLVATVSYFRKVISGKRIYVFEQYDLLLGIMILFVLISGIFLKGIESFENSVMLLFGALGYVLASNLVTNRRLADRFSVAVVISSFPASVYTSVMRILSAMSKVRYTPQGFYSSSVFGTFLIVAIFFGISGLVEAKRLGQKLLFLFVIFVNAATLGIMWNFMAVLSVLLGLLVYLTVRMHRLSALLTVLLSFVGYAVLILPSVFLNNRAVSAFMGQDFDSLKGLWSASVRMFGDNVFFGVGMGAESFSEEISYYLGTGAESSSNIFLEIACEAGIFALVFFLLVLMSSLRHRSIYRSYVKHSEVRTVSTTAMAAIVALIIYGTLNYIWAETELCYIFWCVFGLGSATLRIAKREYDDRITYYNDVVSRETSDVDVQIDGFELKK